MTHKESSPNGKSPASEIPTGETDDLAEFPESSWDDDFWSLIKPFDVSQLEPENDPMVAEYAAQMREAWADKFRQSGDNWGKFNAYIYELEAKALRYVNGLLPPEE